jgi:hypothetical protein
MSIKEQLQKLNLDVDQLIYWHGVTLRAKPNEKFPNSMLQEVIKEIETLLDAKKRGVTH